LAQDLINKGCDVNLIIPEVELTPLQMSMTRRSGEMTMFLLQNEADPQIRSPNCPVSCMTLLALRPLGSLCREITNQLIQCGITYDTEPGSFVALYHRAVKEGWYDVASDLLANGNVNKAKLEEGLLADLLWQNIEASLGPIMYLLKPQHGYGQASPIVSERKRWTVFHQLARIPEDFRDDELNKRIVNYLIEKFPQLEIFDQKDADGKTALTIAVHYGNRHLVAALLNAGASPYAGNIHALMIIVDRALFPKTFSGGFVGISRRRQRRTRFEHNTVCMLSLLLKHDLEKRLFGASQEDLVDATKILTKWRATEYSGQYITSSLREILGPSVTAEFPQDDLHVRDSESGLSRRATLTEAKHGGNTIPSSSLYFVANSLQW
jgi:ankyrin repeat protein